MNYESVIPPQYGGVVSVSHDFETVYEKAFGYSDYANKIANETGTRFATASAGKMFVASGILKLIEQNKLSFESTIGKILSFELNQIDPQITVRELLNHTSGIPDYFDESVMSEYAELFAEYPNYKIRSSSDLLPFFINKPMMYKRGEKFQYNNTGYVVLGLIIEEVTGILFDKYLGNEVFVPCGMPDTGYYELDRLPAKCANSYIFDKARQEYYTNIYSVDVKGTGAGGAFTTARDIANFWKGLYSGKIISKSMLEKMTSPQVEEECYGYGVWLKKSSDGAFMPWFQGSDPGVSFISSFDVRNHRIVTLLSNFGDNVWQINREISNLTV